VLRGFENEKLAVNIMVITMDDIMKNEMIKANEENEIKNLF
jgi:hypothetical protein